MVISQIYSPVDADEALRCVELGSDYIGEVTGIGLSSKHNDIFSVEHVRGIFDAIRGKAVCVLIGIERDPEKLLDLCIATGAEIAQNVMFDHEADIRFFELRNERMPSLKIMKSVFVRDQASVDEALEAVPYCDMIILDSPGEGTVGGGTTGKIHDWSLSKQIIDNAGVPVILAGGLGPDNLAEAIETLHPFGVDSFSKVSVLDEEGRLVGKDFDKVAEFCRIAHSY
ncbi:MAG: hypothetical protein IKE27_11055 [Oscillospiraceae bacterium]|nr:hypothetical protein [Oscillospiraceae bacterium]